MLVSVAPARTAHNAIMRARLRTKLRAWLARRPMKRGSMDGTGPLAALQWRTTDASPIRGLSIPIILISLIGQVDLAVLGVPTERSGPSHLTSVQVITVDARYEALFSAPSATTVQVRSTEVPTRQPACSMARPEPRRTTSTRQQNSSPALYTFLTGSYYLSTQATDTCPVWMVWPVPRTEHGLFSK